MQRRSVIIFGGPTKVQRPIVSHHRVCVNHYVNIPNSALFVSSLFSIVSPRMRFGPSGGQLCTCPMSGRGLVALLVRALSVSSSNLVNDDSDARMHDFDHCRCCLLRRTVGKGG